MPSCTVVLGEPQQLHEMNGFFGADFPIIIGLCSSFLWCAMIHLFYANFFMSLQGQNNATVAQELSVREAIQH